MIIESGVIIFIGLLLLYAKLPHSWRLRLLGAPLSMDITVSIVAYVLHWGTFSGVMAAAVAGLMCSGFSMVGRWAYGYTDKTGTHLGVFLKGKGHDRIPNP